MSPHPTESQAVLRVQRKSLHACALFFLVGICFFLVVEKNVTWPLVALQLGCSASFAALAHALGRGWVGPGTTKLGSVFIGMVAATALVHLSGGPASPYFQVFGALPCLIAMFTPEDRLPTLLSGAMTLGAVLLLDTQAGLPPRLIVMQLTGFTLFTALSLFGTRTYRRMGDAKREAQQERVQALERLAESERLRMRAERERAQVERLVLVGQLAAGVAHEVNNPLAYVKANLAHLEREARDAARPLDRAELCEVLAETRQGVLRIQQIVLDLKGFARAGEEEGGGRIEEALQEARRLASVRLGGRGEVRLAMASGLPEVRLGQRHLVQVVLNLLINAMDAVEGADATRLARIDIGARVLGDTVQLEVEDNGPGIASDVLPRLFDPFFTTKPPGKGTGLGLALCREYVLRVGGTLHAENRAQGGARFVLRLPRALAAPVPNRPAERNRASGSVRSVTPLAS
ncbi:sensor histidine kinase [Archangium primigenium]|uniref:sensor histidine kinase n=1 Tax=[Archangium] primigenium TaxID=2792470 RepID=UPI0019596942|nr:ATP-binding protein [Archangium primigenium]MBM7115501.1 histidine kinase [Archangium primigenium]